jgi:DNA-binding transcriptional ArsR family regulator
MSIGVLLWCRPVADDRCDLLCLDLPKAERLRAERLDAAMAQLLAERAKALSDSTRLTLAAALSGTDELCVCDLAWVSERAENLVSHHLRALRAAGLVSGRRDGKMVMYSLTDSGRSLLQAVLGGAAVSG